MKSYDYYAMVLDGDVFCTEHLTKEQKEESHPIFADSEWDFYPVCCQCDEVHDYVNLTDDGRIDEGVE